MTPNLKTTAEAVLAAGEKAIPRPWSIERGKTCFLIRKNNGMALAALNKTVDKETALYLIDAANSAEKIARAVLILEKVTDTVQSVIDDLECREDEDCDHCVIKALLDEAIKKASEVCK